MISHIAPLIKDLAVIIGSASIVAIVFQYIRQPIVLGYLLTGLILGPYTPPYAFVNDIPTLTQIAELGVIFLMFSIGLEFSFQKIYHVGKVAAIVAVIEVAIMVVIGYAVGKFIGWRPISSLFLGVAIAISSTTIIVKTLEEMNLKNEKFANLVFGILIIEDFLAIILLAWLSAIATTEKFSVVNDLIDSAQWIAIIGGWFVVGYYILPKIFHMVRYRLNEETLTLLSVGCCLALVCIAAYFHFSIALGAFIMGSILAAAPQVHRIQELLKPIRDIFAAIFFVSVGMLVDPRVIFHDYKFVLLISLITVFGKILSSIFGGMLTKQSMKTSIRLGFSMAQIGEFSFIIVGMGVTLGAVNQELSPIIVAVSAITTFCTPYLIRLSVPVANYYKKITGATDA